MKIGPPPPKVTFFHPCPYFQPLTQSLSLGLHLLLGPSRKPPGDFLSNFTGHLNIPPWESLFRSSHAACLAPPKNS